MDIQTDKLEAWMRALSLEDTNYVRLAVYGTLRQGGRLHRGYLHRSVYAGTFKTPGELWHLRWARFPIATVPSTNHEVVCEVYLVPYRTAVELFYMETATGLYDGVVLDINGLPTGIFVANDYGREYAQKFGTLIETGDFTCTNLLSTPPSTMNMNTVQQDGTNGM